MSVKTRRTRTAAVLLAGALSIGGALAGMGAAHAQTLDNINPDTPRKLTIHKHEDLGRQEVKPDGTAQLDTPKPLKDVEFKVYQLTSLNLATTHADWVTLQDKIAKSPTGLPANICQTVGDAGGDVTINGQNFTFGAPQTHTTNQDGQIVITNPAIAAYLVCETDASNAKNAAGEAVHVVSTAAPFIATVPMPYEKNWLYDVHAYPKNSVGGITKENVKQEDLGLNSSVQFKVTSTIPKLPQGKDDFKSYVVSDTFDSRLAPKAGNAAVASVKINGQETRDYTVVHDGQTVRVAFDPTGLARLAANQGRSVEVIFDTTVTSIGNGTIKNKAEYYSSPDNEWDPNGPTPPPPGVPSNEVVTKWGDARIMKYADGEENRRLENAKFKVYPASDPYADTCVATRDRGAQPISINGQTEFTSNDQGVVTISGLFVSSMYTEYGPDGAVTFQEGNQSDHRCYVLEETEPPVGYIASAPVALRVEAGQTADTAWDVKVENKKPIVPGLPLTGGTGTVVLSLTGLLLVGGAAATIAYGASRRKTTEAALA